MARRGLGRTSPNPPVGAVVYTPGGIILAAAVTAQGGRPHAEAQAVAAAGDAARGASLAVTLEPCVHHGVTPPCAGAIVAAGIARVVVGSVDPDPRMHGHGLAQLRAAGIAVSFMPPLLAEAARALAAGHVTRVERGRPFVQAKVALGADGLVPRGDGAPRFVSGPETLRLAHLLRAEADAIIIGAGTLAADDPSLDCRLPGMAERSPLRVLVSSAGLVPAGAKLASGGRGLLVVCAEGIAPPGVETLHVPATPAGLDLAAMLRALAARGITRVLIEGGPTLVAAALRAGVVDELVLIRAARSAGADGLPFDVALAPGPLADTRRLGDDRIEWYRAGAG